MKYRVRVSYIYKKKMFNQRRGKRPLAKRLIEVLQGVKSQVQTHVSTWQL